MADPFNLPELLKQNFGRYQFKEDISNPAAIIRGISQRDTETSQAGWLLERRSVVGDIVTVEYADNAQFTQVWDDRLASFGAPPGAGNTGTTPETGVFSLPTPGNEEAFVLQDGLSNLVVRNRTQVDTRLSFTAGGTTTDYLTLKAGAVFSLSGINFSEKTLYAQSASASTLEVLQVY